MLDEPDLRRDSVFRVGRVRSVDGRRVRISVDKLKNSSHLLFQGGVVRNVGVASYIKIAKGFAEIIAKIDGEHVAEDATSDPEYQRSVDRVSRELEVSLIGYIEGGKFERGVRELPLLDNECFILTADEFNLVHTFVSAADVPLTLGTLAMEPTQRVDISVNSIFASHIGIFGNTGSGKSYTLAKLYYELLKHYENEPSFRERAQFVLIDFNGEYVNRAATDNDVRSTQVVAPPEMKSEYVLSTRSKGGQKLPLSRGSVHDPVFWTVLLDATEKTQAPFLSRVLTSDYWERRLQDPQDILGVIGDMVLRATTSSDITIDRQTVINLLTEIETCFEPNVPQSLIDLKDDFQQNLHFNPTQRRFYWGQWAPPYVTPDDSTWPSLTRDKVAALSIDFSTIKDIDLVRFKIIVQYYSDVISGFSNREHLGPLIKRLQERVPDIKKLVEISEDPFAKTPLVVVSLRDVNLAMRKVIPMLLCKQLYDEKKEKDQTSERYLNLIIDEAHNILSKESTRESEAWRDYRLETFEEIVKEGRKFGVFLTIASQRPHDISETIISQLHNYFLHRLINNLDIHAIEKAVAYLDRVSFESLPILPTGTCVLAGVSAQVPVVVKVDPLPEEAEPNSRTMMVTETWLKPLVAAEGLAESEVAVDVEQPSF